MPSTRLPLASFLLVALVAHASADPLPGTKALPAEGDRAREMVAGIDKYLMRELAASVEKRKQYWKPDYSSPEAFARSVEPQRERLRKILGVVDQRGAFKDLDYVSHTTSPLVAEGKDYKVYSVRWPVFEGVDAEGLLLEPNGKAKACVVAIPDADQTPEMIVGLAPGVAKESQFARRLAENGCRVLVPTLIDRNDTWSGNPRIRMTNQPHREYIYRQAFEMGRHIIGYEIQKVLAAVDYFTKEKGHPPVGVAGYGEGALIALYTGAIDTRVKVTGVSNYLSPRERLWQEPIYRNVWGLLREFGDAEVLTLLVPRQVVLEYEAYVTKDGPKPATKERAGAAPGKLEQPVDKVVYIEFDRYRDLIKKIPGALDNDAKRIVLALVNGGDRTPNRSTLQPFLEFLSDVPLNSQKPANGEPLTDLRKGFDPAPRQKRQFEQLTNFTQKLMRDADLRRDAFVWKKLEKIPADKLHETAQPLRDYLWEEVIGKLPAPTEKRNPRSRVIYDEPKWTGYEVTLDLYPDVFAYGILLLPKDLKPGEKRPVVVCQHGLEGRPQDVCNPKEKTRAYNSYGAALADRGYIVYAPQNPYIFKDDFRVLQRKANPLKLSLFSFIIRQHEATLDWLATHPNVDGDRIGFYGLSYGGKTAMRVPAILPKYACSICSGDFNEWIWKNVSVDFRGSYMFTGEYEMFEFDLGNTFNYAEMAALIAPRPFMVERGHDDGVGIDEWVSLEFAKVRRFYAKNLKLPDRTEIEYFPGGHEINGKGSYDFLDRHLKFKK